MNAVEESTILKKHTLENYTTYKGVQFEKLDTSYQIFGQPLHSAPIVLVNHAFTGNSDVISEEKGWWRDLIGEDKLIDTSKYTIIAFNIPGNGYDGVQFIKYKSFIAKDIARIFHIVLQTIEVTQVHAIIGGSLGGGLAWEIAALYPNFAKYIIPIAADWKSTDWIIGHNSIQETILLNSNKPLQDARKMAMLFYRSPASFKKRFERKKQPDNETFSVASWLSHHGKKLEGRFSKEAYLMMNNLLSTIDIGKKDESIEDTFKSINSKIIQISVNSDLFFVKEENEKTKAILDQLNIESEYYEIKSIDGHDAFLIEHEQITDFLKDIF